MFEFIVVSDKSLIKKIGTPEFDQILTYLLSQNFFTKIYLPPRVYKEYLKAINQIKSSTEKVEAENKFHAIFQSANFIGSNGHEDDSVPIEEDLYSIYSYLENLGEENIIILTDNYDKVKTEESLSTENFANYCSSVINSDC